jgi:hypothetical protein
MKYVLLSLGILGSVSQGFAAPVSQAQNSLLPQSTPCISPTFSSTGTQYWQHITLTLTNNCEHIVDFQNSTITFETSAPIDTAFWGDFGGMSYPDNVLNITSKRDVDGKYLAVLQLHFPEQSWATTKLPVHSTMHIKYGAEADTHLEESTQVYLGKLLIPDNLKLKHVSSKQELVTPSIPPIAKLTQQGSVLRKDGITLNVLGAPQHLATLTLTFSPDDGSAPIHQPILLSEGIGFDMVSLQHGMKYIVNTDSMPGYKVSFSPQPLIAAADAIATVTFIADTP